MKRVLICIPSFSRGNGISKFIMTYYNSLIENTYLVDFLLVEKGTSDSKYLDVVIKNNSKIYYIPTGSVFSRINRTMDTMNQILKSNQYDIVHVNLVDLYAYGCIKSAKKNNINKILYHVHNPYTLTKLLFLRNILNYACIKMSTDLVACTESAGKSMFHKKEFSIIRNAICFENYKYNSLYREHYRQELNLEKKFIIGAVGRLTNQKNPLFAIKIFNEILKQKNNAHFIWIGVGDMKNELLNYAKVNKIDDKITFLCDREDVNKIYSAFDIFLLPSKYEGLGIVFLEAECSGLPIYTSNKVPTEIKKCNLVHFLSLNNSPKYWANEILKNSPRFLNRSKFFDILKNSDYNFESNQNALIDLYEGRDM